MCKPFRINCGELPNERENGNIRCAGLLAPKETGSFQTSIQRKQEYFEYRFSMRVPVSLFVSFGVFVSIEMELEVSIIPGKPFKILR